MARAKGNTKDARITQRQCTAMSLELARAKCTLKSSQMPGMHAAESSLRYSQPPMSAGRPACAPIPAHICTMARALIPLANTRWVKRREFANKTKIARPPHSVAPMNARSASNAIRLALQTLQSLPLGRDSRSTGTIFSARTFPYAHTDGAYCGEKGIGMTTKITLAGIPQVYPPVSTAPLYRLEAGRALTASTW